MHIAERWRACKDPSNTAQSSPWLQCSLWDSGVTHPAPTANVKKFQAKPRQHVSFCSHPSTEIQSVKSISAGHFSWILEGKTSRTPQIPLRFVSFGQTLDFSAQDLLWLSCDTVPCWLHREELRGNAQCWVLPMSFEGFLSWMRPGRSSLFYEI